MGIRQVGAQIQAGYQSAKAYVFEADPRREYSQNSPLYHAMDGWGQKPIVGLFTGAGRAVYGTAKLGLGTVGVALSATLVPLARLVEMAARRVLGKPGQMIHMKGCLKATGKFAFDGLYHLIIGLVEVLTLGCLTFVHRAYFTLKARRADDATLSSMRGPAYNAYPQARRAAEEELSRRRAAGISKLMVKGAQE